MALIQSLHCGMPKVKFGNPKVYPQSAGRAEYSLRKTEMPNH